MSTKTWSDGQGGTITTEDIEMAYAAIDGTAEGVILACRRIRTHYGSRRHDAVFQRLRKAGRIQYMGRINGQPVWGKVST